MPGLDFVYIDHQDGLQALAEALAEMPTATVAIDTETTGLDPLEAGARLLLLQIGLANGNLYVINCCKVDLEPLRGILDNGTVTIDGNGTHQYGGRCCILQNAKFDYKWLRVKAGIRLRRVYDTQLAELILVAGLYEVHERRGKVSLKALTEKYCGRTMDKETRLTFVGHQGDEFTPEQLQYAAEDLPSLWEIKRQQVNELKQFGLQKTAELEFGVVPYVGDMELAGISVNRPEYEKVIADSRLEMAAAERDCQRLVTEKGGYVDLFGDSHLNLGSPDQVKQAFKDHFGLDLKSTDDKALKRLGDHPFAVTLRNFRDWETQVTSFGEKILEHLHPVTGRLHSEFKQMGGDAGRFTCEKPNLQQIPADKKYRSLFIPRPGNLFVDADWQAMEMRILAKISGDKKLLEAFVAGRDLHSHTAATMYGLDYDAVVATHKDKANGGSPERDRAKTLNFALLYGMGVPSLAEELKCSKEDAQAAMDRYFDAFPGVAAFMKRQDREGPALLEVRTLGGRRRVFNPPKDKREVGAIQRRARNTPMQGCLSGDTRIFTKFSGYVPIRDLCGYDIEVWDGERFSRASVVASGKKQLVRVTLWGGHYIECSPDHRFLVKNTHGASFWRRAEEINAQDRVVLTSELPSWGRSPLKVNVAPPPASIRTNTKSLQEVADMAVLLDKEEWLGEWFGRLASDGNITHAVVSQFVAEHEEQLLQRLEDVTDWFGTWRTVTRKPTEAQPKRFHQIRLCSRSLCRQLLQVGVKDRIPDFIWQSDALLAGYLRGLFDGDGMAHADGPVLTFGQGAKHLQWAREVQQTLLLFGIRSRINAYEGGGSHRINLCVLKRDTALFCERVGFMNPEKQAKAESIEAKYSARKPERLSTIYGNAARVKSVEVTNQWVDMFDVVDSETHRFMANGIIVHNSNGDAMKRAMTLLGYRLECAGILPGIVLTVHDELLVECPEERAEETLELVRDSMNEAASFYLQEVPAVTEAKIVPYWSK